MTKFLRSGRRRDLCALAVNGFVVTETEGLHDVYVLTGPGERRLREHHAWLGEQRDG